MSWPAPLPALLAAAGLEATPRASHPALWQQVAATLPYLPVAYSAAMIDYQLAYFRGAGQAIADASLILHHDHRPCGIWPLSFVSGDPGRLGSNGGPVLPPLFSTSLPDKSRKKISAACVELSSAWAAEAGAAEWETLCGFADHTGLDHWHEAALRRGARSCVSHELLVDLSFDLTTIKSNIRKSYKALITSGQKLWQVDVLTDGDTVAWAEFQSLHQQVAGRATRSHESWQRQCEAVASGDAFLIRLRDAVGTLVGGGFFHVTRNEGLYAVAAYDRSLFDKPLGHVVQFRAIEELKRRGVRWYRIGARPYPADVPGPSQKELAIAEFKDGFATHLMPMFRLTVPAALQASSLSRSIDTLR